MKAVKNDWVSQKREYVGAACDPTAQSDMQALRARFDRSGDGKLTAADTDFGKFMGVVTGADSSKTVQTLSALGIIKIKLTEDATRVVLADGSAIQGQSTYLVNDAFRIAAIALLMAEALGNRVADLKQAKFEKVFGKVQKLISCCLMCFCIRFKVHESYNKVCLCK